MGAVDSPRTKTIVSVNLAKTRAEPLKEREKLHELRIYTHFAASLPDCMEALTQAHGDLDRAKALLVDQGCAQRKTGIFNRPVDGEVPKGWSYILTKAGLYLRLGPDRYRKADFFGLPRADWDDDLLAEIESCFRQFADGRGYSSDRPVEGVGISGFSAALHTLHFRLVEQRASLTDDSQAFIDEMVLEHVMDHHAVTLYNKVPIDPLGPLTAQD